MHSSEKFQSLFILLAIGIGLLLGQITFFQQHAELFIIPFLLMMLYGLFLTVPITGLKQAFKNTKFLSASILLNFVWNPLLAWGLGGIFLSEHPAVWLGFILLLVTPCTDWYLIFTSIARGNLALSTSMLPINLVLQFILLPSYLFIFSGTVGAFDSGAIIDSILIVLFVPFLFASLTRFLFRKKISTLHNKVIPFFASSQIVFLCLAITAMFAAQGANLLNNLQVILLVLVPFMLFFVINFLVAQTVGKWLKFNYEDIVSLNMTIISRNAPEVLPIVIIAFPDQPLIAMAIIVGPLIELPVLSIVAQGLLKLNKHI
ncbi:Arsenite efflux pump ArsB, ACR3 family [Amphibacillus marinus]|uniref:Arsenite efflux pump ArsB, ACR3 family n=1 Tax=Amphibacillus marinus TaxID=872970 RepID=A0A1H8KIK8_9BACI|nr:bile acid:sodium symporter [Amphibacillus marinus]SEN92732.1 Arsenite efflux pump ArsB, ACR3 family [Amphibacillus marinus]